MYLVRSPDGHVNGPPTNDAPKVTRRLRHPSTAPQVAATGGGRSPDPLDLLCARGRPCGLKPSAGHGPHGTARQHGPHGPERVQPHISPISPYQPRERSEATSWPHGGGQRGGDRRGRTAAAQPQRSLQYPDLGAGRVLASLAASAARPRRSRREQPPAT